MTAQVSLTEDEFIFGECWHNPTALIECLFHDFDSLSEYSETKMGYVRQYQSLLISKECFIDFEGTAKLHGLSKKEKFKMQKRIGDIYCFGARKFGKTMCVEILDLIVTFLHALCKKIAFASVDLIHIREVLDQIKNVFQNHPICKLWEKRITGAPDYKFQLKNNVVANSVNFNVGSKNPGNQWYGKHVERVYIEEASLETEEVYEKRKDALSEMGAIFRISGMTDFTQHSPAGKSFFSLENRNHVVNLPQYVSPMWDEDEKRDRLEFYGGEESIGYKVFVKGEVVADGVSVFDMTRIRDLCYLSDSKGNSLEDLKRFEINRERYSHYQSLIVAERLKQADRMFLSADIGEKVTEIIIHAEIETDYKYLYNITLNNLDDDEQAKLIKWLASKIEANVIAIDCGDGMGRAIYRELEKTIPSDNLVWYDGSSKIEVGFKLNDKKEVVKDDKNQPVIHEEYMSEWSVQRLQTLLYGGRCIIPQDYKFDTQFTVVMSMKSGTRTIYKCVSQNGDHLFDAWRVFAIAQWLKKDFNKTKPVQKEWGTGVNSWGNK